MEPVAEMHVKITNRREDGIYYNDSDNDHMCEFHCCSNTVVSANDLLSGNVLVISKMLSGMLDTACWYRTSNIKLELDLNCGKQKNHYNIDIKTYPKEYFHPAYGITPLTQLTCSINAFRNNELIDSKIKDNNLKTVRHTATLIRKWTAQALERK